MVGYYLSIVYIFFVLLGATFAEDEETYNVGALREQFEKLAENDGTDSLPTKKSSSIASSKELEKSSIELLQSENPKTPIVTSSLINWISHQCESMVEEMDAIAKQNAESNTFSVVNYLRYLHLYDDLKVVVRQQYPELKWVSLKAKVFGRMYEQTLEILSTHLEDLNHKLTVIELAEPKSKQVEVSKAWLDLYERIRYISTHSPVGSKLEKRATELLQTSPNNSPDKQRSMRYQLKVRAFSR